MVTSVRSGDDAAAHLSTDQWQSFEMRMRRRRVERLLARASEACQEGREETAREAVAEIEQLSPSEPRLPELRARIEALSSITSTPAVVPTVIEKAPAASPAPPAEFTSPNRAPVIPPRNFAETVPLEPSSPEPMIVPARNDLLFDLPLMVGEEEVRGRIATAEPEPQGSRGGLAFAALALLACGAIGYLLGPRLVTLTPLQRTGADTSATSVGAPPQTADVRRAETNGAEVTPPLQVAVDEISAANTTVERPTETSETVAQPVVPSPVATTSSETPAASSAAPTGRIDPPALPESSPVAITGLPHEPPAAIEKPTVPTSPENSPAVGVPVASSTPVVETESPAPPAPSPSRESAPPGTPRHEEKIRALLDQYAEAYSRLDAAAATAIFPGLDGRALARAFDGLSSQKVSLGACDVRVAIETAIVDCAGSSTWTPKIGGGTRTEPRRWQFRLRESSGEWQIVGAKVR